MPRSTIPKPVVKRSSFDRMVGNLFGHQFAGSMSSSPLREGMHPVRERGFPYMQVICAPLPPFGEGEALAGSLAPPTPEQFRAKFEVIREGDPSKPTEAIVFYSYPEMFGHAEVQLAMPADECVRLVDGRIVGVTDLWQGMQFWMEDGSIGTVTEDRHLLYEMPDPPRPWKNGLWASRVIGNIKHFGYEVIDFRWAGQTVTVTPDHPFWSASRRGWVPVGELLVGELVRVAGNVVAPVDAIGPRRSQKIELYNVEVEYFHNYFVGRGENAVLVHNGPGYIKRPQVAEALEEGLITETNAYRAGVTRPPRHHVFPQARRGWFSQRGVDIDRYTLPLDESTHQALHYGGGPGKGGGWWNDTIIGRLDAREAALGRQLTPREILAIGAQLRREAGLSHVKVIPYGAP